MEQVENICPEDKKELYELLYRQLESVLEGERDVIANLSNVSAILKSALKDVNWAGFYLMKMGTLILGPFQGNLACVHIPVGRGVCGTAVKEEKTQLVRDVHAFPGHIACDSASRSELVIPIKKEGRILGVLDIDSPSQARFDELDQEGLEKIAVLIADACDWHGCGGYDFTK